jgi:putative spermidine/putrescine transport system permease protein
MMHLAGWPRGAVFTAAWMIALFLLLPGLVTIPVSLNDSRFIALPQGTLSTRHFETLFTSPGWLVSIRDSVVIALAATLLSTAVGTACAIGLWRVRPWLGALVGALMLAPMIFPPIVTALALYRFWVLLGLYDSWIGVVLAHAIVALPYVIIAVTTSLGLLDPRQEMAARSLGASPLRAAIDVILPNIRAGVATGAAFAFIISWDEIVVTLFVSSRAVYTLPRRMWDGIRENVDPTVAAVAAALMALTAVGVLIAMMATALRRRTPPTPS